jgi:hypothetical protein
MTKVYLVYIFFVGMNGLSAGSIETRSMEECRFVDKQLRQLADQSGGVRIQSRCAAFKELPAPGSDATK